MSGAGVLLSRKGPAAPVRIVHLGLGSFFRAHQAWYTAHARDADQWGIAAFTGRRADLATALASQDGLYTLIVRAADGDRFEVLGSVAAVHAASDHARWLDYARSEGLALITLSVTEAGYARSPHGTLDRDDDQVLRDVGALRASLSAPVTSVPAKLLAALVARSEKGLGPLAVVPCDNLPGNGAVVAAVVRQLARMVDPSLVAIVDRTASFVTTMVDRITPGTTDADRALVLAETGRRDDAPVVTEPFTEWVLSGEFPAGRPAWEDAGARIVDEIDPFEQRKLWMLNGAHSLLAYAAPMRGHATVADAVSDPVCRAWLEEWWDDAQPHLALPDEAGTAYRSDLVERFANSRIQHLLTQIATDGSQKLPVRILPVLRAERAVGRVPGGACRAVAAWVCHLRGLGAPVADAHADAAVSAAAGTRAEAVCGVLDLLDADLAADQAVADAVLEHVDELST